MSENHGSVVNGVNQALERLDGDRELLFELFDLFLIDFDQSRGRLKVAIETVNFRAVEEASHSFKSALGNIGAAETSAVCAKLERAGRDSDPEFPYLESLAELDRSFAPYREYMDRLKTTS